MTGCRDRLSCGGYRATDSNESPTQDFISLQTASAIALRKHAHNRLNDGAVVVGFGEEAGANGQLTFIKNGSSRSYYQFYGGPPIPDIMTEFDPIHSAGHLHVGKHQMDIRTGFKNTDRFVGGLRLNYLKPSID